MILEAEATTASSTDRHIRAMDTPFVCAYARVYVWAIVFQNGGIQRIEYALFRVFARRDTWMTCMTWIDVSVPSNEQSVKRDVEQKAVRVHSVYSFRLEWGGTQHMLYFKLYRYGSTTVHTIHSYRLVSTTEWLYVLVQMCRLGRERYFMLMLVPVCASGLFWTSKETRLRTHFQLAFSTKCSQTKINVFSLLCAPTVWHKRSHEIENIQDCFFSLLSAFGRQFVCRIMWAELGMFRWYCTMLENEATADVCVCTSRNRTRNIYVHTFFCLLRFIFSRRRE